MVYFEIPSVSDVNVRSIVFMNETFQHIFRTRETREIVPHAPCPGRRKCRPFPSLNSVRVLMPPRVVFSENVWKIKKTKFNFSPKVIVSRRRTVRLRTRVQIVAIKRKNRYVSRVSLYERPPEYNSFTKIVELVQRDSLAGRPELLLYVYPTRQTGQHAAFALAI